jgi:hypothetical protein
MTILLDQDHNEYDDENNNDDNEENDDNEDNDDEQRNQQLEGEGENDINITDEEMFQIAENTLLKIAQVFMMRDTTVSSLFQNNIIEIKYDDNILPVITPEVFIEGLKALEIENISELELACLMNVIVKPQLANGILVEELESIIENAPQLLNMVNLQTFGCLNSI